MVRFAENGQCVTDCCLLVFYSGGRVGGGGGSLGVALCRLVLTNTRVV